MQRDALSGHRGMHSVAITIGPSGCVGTDGVRARSVGYGTQR